MRFTDSVCIANEILNNFLRFGGGGVEVLVLVVVVAVVVAIEHFPKYCNLSGEPSQVSSNEGLCEAKLSSASPYDRFQ